MAGTWRPLSLPEFGAEVYWRDNGDDTADIMYKEDVAGLLEQNQQKANDGDGWSRDKDKVMRSAASIPQVILTEYRNKGINLTDPNYFDELKKLLNDGDFRKLRTANWRV